MILAAFQDWIVETGLVVSLLIVVILLIRRPFARTFGANAAYALWSLPLIRLCLPTFSIPQNWAPEFLKLAPERLAVGPSLEFSANNLQSTIDPSEASLAQLPAEEATLWDVFFIGIWLSVAVLWLSYQLIQQFRFKSYLSVQTLEPPAQLSVEIGRAADNVGLGKLPNVRIAHDGVGPFVTGVLNPLVILPNNFDETFTAQQRHFALIHEFSHIKRRDLWVAMTALVFRAVNWPNPLVHYAFHKLRGDQEAACDAFVVKVTGGETAHSYAETLVKAARQERASPRQHSHLALSLTATDEKISKGD